MRLLAFDAAVLDPGDVDAVGHLALLAATPWPPGGASCAVAADPLRLPFVAALFDTVVVSGPLARDMAGVLREVRRVAAPAADVWLIVPRRHVGLRRGRCSRARLERLLGAAMLTPVEWTTCAGMHLVRATPSGGAAAAPIGRVTALRPATA